MIASCVLIWTYYYKGMTLKYQYMELYSDDRSFSRLDMALYWDSMPFECIAMTYYNVSILHYYIINTMWHYYVY